MEVVPIKTRIFTPPEDLWGFLKEYLPQKIGEKSVLVISSKVVALSQKRVSSKPLKTLVLQESDEILAQSAPNLFLTIKNGIYIANAGIDASNVPHKQLVLWPKNPFLTAQKIQNFVQENWKIQNFGVVISDSRVTPRRRGTVGVCIGWSGFEGVEDLRGEQDLFGRILRISTVNMADNLASSAEILMGQGAECIPLVLISNAPIRFTTKKQGKEKYEISETEDIFPPFLKTSSSKV